MTGMIVIGETEIAADDVNAHARKLASGLDSLGLNEGDVIGVMLRNCQEYLELINASRQIGSYYCPINWHFTAEEVKFILQDSGTHILVVQAEFWGKLKPVVPPGMSVIIVGDHPDAINHLNGQVKHFETWRDSFSEHTVYSKTPRGHMAYTSGTTGKPKGVVRIPFNEEEAQAKQNELQVIVRQTLGLEKGCRALLPAPLYHSAPSLFAQVALQVCDVFVLTEKFDPLELLRLIEKFRIEVVYLVPIMYVRMLKLDESVRKQYDLSSVRFIASTGAPCAPEVKRAMIEWFGPVVYETYASSEAGLITLVDSVQALDKPGTAGLPVGQAEIKIYDDAGQECKTGEVGHIYVRQYAYTDFYYRNNPEARKKVERNGLINLGDIGYLDKEGYLFVCDRNSDLVISGGVNIYPAEIEHQILQYSGVADCAVLGIPDNEFGEALLAYIQPYENTELQVGHLREWLGNRLAKYKIPKQLLIKHDLPRDDNGKIYKRFLRDKFWEGKARKV